MIFKNLVFQALETIRIRFLQKTFGRIEMGNRRRETKDEKDGRHRRDAVQERRGEAGWGGGGEARGGLEVEC